MLVQPRLGYQVCIFRFKQKIMHRGVFDDKKLGENNFMVDTVMKFMWKIFRFLPIFGLHTKRNYFFTEQYRDD